MQILEKEKISALIQIGFAGCAKGQIFQARRLFEGLLCADSELVGAKIGLAFSYIVVDDFDRVIQRVKVNAFCRHTDHIHMGLQDHLRRLFISCGGRLVNDDIAELIPDSGQAMASGPVHEIVANLLLVM